MTSVLITIETPDGPLDLSVPAQLTIGHLLDIVTPDRVGFGDLRGWTLGEPGGTPFDSSQTLEALGVLDGARLSLVPAGVDHPIRCRPSAPSTRVTADDRSRRVIPGRTPTPERILIALNAFVGRHRPPGARGPVDRMRQGWAWTEHERRLDWLLTRPRILRSILIGVVGHRSDELAESLADTLAAARLERVALVDGGTAGSITRRLREVGAGFEAVESGLRRTDLTSIERDLLFGRTDLGTLAVPVDPTAPLPDAATMRRLCDTLPNHAGLIVIDCGTLELPNAALMERCDQMVVSTTGVVPHVDGQAIGAIWGGVQLPQERNLHASHHISDDAVSIAELAVVVAAGWSAIDAATPVPLGL
jgi:hypothetical protein